MKTLYYFLFINFFSFGQADSLSVLFIGNSYIASNNLPSLISSIASSMGDQISFETSLVGGATLQYHANNQNTIELIIDGNWDYVVIQEQSQYPSFPIWQVEQDVFPYASELSQLIYENNECGEVVFFMTWGRENGDQDNCTNWPPICTYEGMDDLLRDRYLIMANENNAQVSPVGATWRFIRDSKYNLDLYGPDGSHPSFLGSYVAAVCFYTTLFQKSPLDIPWTTDLNISAYNDSLIKGAVQSVVFDNLEQWDIHSNDIDSDGLCNNTDNCPENYNPNQEDTNNNGSGDACDGDVIGTIEQGEITKNVRFVDFLGRQNNNTSFQLKLFDDGSVEKKFIINTPYD